MAKRKKSRRGVGQTITIRRMKGLGQLRRPASFMGATVPPFLGGALTGGVTIATRYWARPAEGNTQKALYQWAPLIGLGAGGIASLAMAWTVGVPAALGSFAASTAVTLSQMLHDWILKDRIGDHALAFPPMAAGNGNGTAGMGVVVPQRLMGAGTRGIVMEPTASRDPLRRYGLGANTAFGQEVSLGAVNARAFGTPGF